MNFWSINSGFSLAARRASSAENSSILSTTQSWAGPLEAGTPGGNFGWPYCYGNKILDKSQSKDYDCSKTIAPKVEMQAHSAPLNLIFYNSDMFPAEYRNNVYVALHGSWNRSVPTGYKVIRVKLNDQGQPEGQPENFITGWLREGETRKGTWMGRPVGLAIGPDGAMYLADDSAGVVYRITYQK